MINKSIKINKFPAEFRIDGRYITDNKIIAIAFNSYFSNIGRNMAQQIINPVKSYHDLLPAKTNLKVPFGLIDIEETTSVISNSKNKSSFDHDSISNKLVKLIKSVIIKTSH